MTLLRSVFSYDPAGWRPVGALLRGLGVALAASIGETVGGHGAAVLAGVGALYAGIASFGGVHPARLRRMLAAVGAASLATLVGSLVEPSVPATILTVTLFTFLLSILGAGGPDSAQVVLLATGTLVVFSGLPGASTHPFQNTLLVLGGGLGQAAILMAFHPISPVAAERRAVEAVYAGLARFARERAQGRRLDPLPNVALPASARDLLRESFRYGDRPEVRQLWSELELADALRGNLAGLDRTDAPATVWEAISAWLEACADATGRGRPIPRELPPQGADGAAGTWLARIGRTVAAAESGRLPESAPVPGAWLAALRNVATLREIALGHALRYALALGLITAAYRILRVDHGYWAALALAFSLRPDFAGTVTRGLGRIVGTAAGVALSTAMVAIGHPSSAWLTAAMLAAAWAAFALQNASFVGYSAALAFYVVISVILSGASATTVGIERLMATAAGSTLALVTAFAWPRWEAGKARNTLAVAFAAQAAYADAVHHFADRDFTMTARLQARAARLEAERIVSAAAFEPSWSRRQHLQGAGAALARLAENAAGILSAHVAALDPVGEDSTVDLRRLAAEDRGMAAGSDGLTACRCPHLWNKWLRQGVQGANVQARPSRADSETAARPEPGLGHCDLLYRRLPPVGRGRPGEPARLGRLPRSCGDPRLAARSAKRGARLRPDRRRKVLGLL